MDEGEALERLAGARVARLATADAAGAPHVVPFVFVLEDRTIYWAVDHKPKRSHQLKRLDNIRVNPNVAVVADHYDEDWSRLWWVRASGTARLVDDQNERAMALEALAMKYAQYRDQAPDGPVVAIDVVRIGGWSAA
jgi:PPOX class probable F420-dependent enzyme